MQGPKPPHLYALTNTMYHNMMMEHENQCVIIRLVPNKLIMVQVVFNYKRETQTTHGGCRITDLI